MQQNPRSRTVLVTGGAKRLGRAIVEGMANYGFNVAIHANQSIDEAESAGEEEGEEGGGGRQELGGLLEVVMTQDERDRSKKSNGGGDKGK